jgi:hypothetical protein
VAQGIIFLLANQKKKPDREFIGIMQLTQPVSSTNQMTEQNTRFINISERLRLTASNERFVTLLLLLYCAAGPPWIKTTKADYYVKYASQADATTSRLIVLGAAGWACIRPFLPFHFQPHNRLQHEQQFRMEPDESDYTHDDHRVSFCLVCKLCAANRSFPGSIRFWAR